MTRFGDFQFDHRTLELTRHGQPVKLQPQPARVLSLLLERRGELVTRDELRRSIWGDETFVDFSRGLNFCIRQIRAALGDSADGARYLETLRGRGYRFLAMDEPLVAAPPVISHRTNRALALVASAAAVIACAWAITAGLQPSASVVTVARFAAGTPADESWASSLRAQVVAHLDHTPLRVVDAASATADSGWRLDARVDRSPSQYRVTVTLRNSDDGSVRWSDVFDGPPGDWIEAQNEMAQIVSHAVRYYVDGPAGGAIPRRVPRRPSPFSS